MSESNIILYTSPNGQVSVQVQYEDGSFWLTQKRMAELFYVDVHTMNEHLQNCPLFLGRDTDCERLCETEWEMGIY